MMIKMFPISFSETERFRLRPCNNPSPTPPDGLYCVGPGVEFEDCEYLRDRRRHWPSLAYMRTKVGLKPHSFHFDAAVEVWWNVSWAILHIWSIF